jgi:hypothetical protein
MCPFLIDLGQGGEAEKGEGEGGEETETEGENGWREDVRGGRRGCAGLQPTEVLQKQYTLVAREGGWEGGQL